MNKIKFRRMEKVGLVFEYGGQHLCFILSMQLQLGGDSMHHPGVQYTSIVASYQYPGEHLRREWRNRSLGQTKKLVQTECWATLMTWLKYSAALQPGEAMSRLDHVSVIVGVHLVITRG